MRGGKLISKVSLQSLTLDRKNKIKTRQVGIDLT